MNTITWFVLSVTTSLGTGYISPPVPGAEACNTLMEAVIKGYSQATDSAAKDGDIMKPTVHISVQCVAIRQETIGKAKGW